MALVENRIIDGKIQEYSKVNRSIQWLRSFEPKEGYWLAFSGGKDSVVIERLAELAGVKYYSFYALTTLDPPELVRFIKDNYPKVDILKPKESMWKLMVRKGFPPTRMIRYCCDELKETVGKGHVTITGVRWAESASRKKNRNLVDIGKMSKKGFYNDDNDEARRMVETCYRKSITSLNVIIDWTDEDVWEFIRTYNVRYCCLYDEGFARLGCIGCPLSSNQKDELERYPKYARAYKRSFAKIIENRKEKGLPCNQQFESADTLYDYFIDEYNGKTTELEGQIEMEDI